MKACRVAIERGFPHDFMDQPMVQQVVHAGAIITPRS